MTSFFSFSIDNQHAIAANTQQTEDKDMANYKTETELRDYATEQAKTIVIRTYTNGNSDDTRRRATKAERHITFSCIFGALLAINQGSDKGACLSAAEFTANLLYKPTTTHEKHPNNYDSVYCPIYNYKF